MSHELRTPLNHIIGFTELVEDGRFGALNDQQHEHLRDVLTSARHLQSLVGDLLDLSKVEAGKLDLELSQVSVSGVINEAIRSVQPEARQSRVTLNADDADPDLEVRADERRLRQVITNLLTNAVRYAPGGTVTVTVGGDGRSVIIKVADDGVGLSTEDVTRIFKPFVRSRESKRMSHGTGLGLSIAREIARMHDGTLTAESDGPGHGATFVLDIPVGGPKTVLTEEKE
jgi:signal transduction histidine kinase